VRYYISNEEVQENEQAEVTINDQIQPEMLKIAAEVMYYFTRQRQAFMMVLHYNIVCFNQ
jgi:hypothetical protein